jgi:hypothetical protein
MLKPAIASKEFPDRRTARHARNAEPKVGVSSRRTEGQELGGEATVTSIGGQRVAVTITLSPVAHEKEATPEGSHDAESTPESGHDSGGHSG